MEKIGIYTKLMRKEETACKAIESVLEQSFGDFCFYIRVSSETIDLVNEYAQKDSRIKILFDPKKKVSFSQDSFIICNSHEFITTIDADDWVSKDYLESMYLFAKENNADIVAAGNFFSNDEGEKLGARRSDKSIVLSREKFMLKIPIYYQFFRTMWGKLWSCKIWKEITEIPNGDKYGEYGGDTLACFYLLKHAEKIGVIDKVVYWYRMGQNFATKSLKEGRLKSDEALFVYVKDVLTENNALTADNYLFLLLIYKNAVKDTLQLIANVDVDEEKRLELYKEVLFHPRTVELLGKSEERSDEALILNSQNPAKLMYSEIVFSRILYNKSITALLHGYYFIYLFFYPELTGKMTEDLFGIICSDKILLEQCLSGNLKNLCIGLICILDKLSDNQREMCLVFIDRVASDSLLSTLLDDSNFVRQNRELAVAVLCKKYDEVLQICNKLLLEDNVYYSKIVELYLNVAAKEENANHFIEAKIYKYNFLLNKGDLDAAEAEANDLREMGVQI